MRKKLRYLYYRAVRGRGSPRELAFGMAIGAAISVTPTLGHTPVAVALAAVTGQSKLAAAAGVWVNNPVTMPFLYGLAYAVGAWFLGKPLRPPSGFLHAMTNLASLTSGVLLPLWLGSVLVGIPLGAATYLATYWAVVTYRKRKAERRSGRQHRWHWTEERGWHRLTHTPGDAPREEATDG